MFTHLDADGNAAGTEVFADGWLDEDTGEYRGRPMDVAFLRDGSMLVSDDFAGAIWRIAYTGDSSGSNGATSTDTSQAEEPVDEEAAETAN